ncbi:hypothetical protein NX02_14875 [Sphingomonas sanxanigenens DSM 19645 = NX02]|uniref:Uncharacterized protein n=1 Tax=Sphingomonas sanxanigenens DSM 19645 = NX02 TaxID=1123269 RepID=W0A9Q5_9SPHN|nr:hypothetical protein NX02_14875 [Sphingomonas sanxanigenens DSM 19645 = NX02]
MIAYSSEIEGSAKYLCARPEVNILKNKFRGVIFEGLKDCLHLCAILQMYNLTCKYGAVPCLWW